MNLLKKQGFFNSIILYIGTGLGFFNLIILFQRFLTAEQIGFFVLISSVSIFYTQISAIGFASVITRYFPFFKTEDKKHNGFPLYTLKITFIGFAIVTIFYVFGRELLQQLKKDDRGSSLFFQYYYLIIPVALFTLWYNLAENFSRTTFHNIFPSFLREVLLKLLTSIAVILIFYQVLNYESFVFWYITSNGFILFLLLIYMKKLDLIRFGPISNNIKKQSPEIIRYGLYSMLAGGSFVMIQNIDTIMLKIFSSESMIGYYGTFFGMAIVINLPAKALNTTSYQIIADAWKTEDLAKINKIYKKTSLVQFMLGSILLIGLIANWENVLFLLYKPEYANFYWVFIIIGMGFLFDITGGLNGAIISFSKNYKLVMYILIFAALLCVLLNILLIPKLGMLGAALSYTITMFSLNFSYWAYLYYKFKLQPFNFQFLKLILISLLVLAFGLWVPYVFNFFLDVSARSISMLVIYTAFIYLLKISPDINDLIDQIFRKLKLK